MTDWRCSGVWSQYLEISTCAIRPGPSAFDRQRRHRRLHDGLAGPAAQLRAQVADHLEAGRDVFEHFALVLADAAEGGAAATRAGAGWFVDDALARQVLGQRLADRLAALAWAGWEGGMVRTSRLGRADAGLGVLRGEVFFEAADQQFKLFDVAIELFRGAAEACAS